MSLINKYITYNRENYNQPAVVFRQGEDYLNIDTDELFRYVGALSVFLMDKYAGKVIAIIGRNSLEYVISMFSVLGSVGDVLLIDNELSKEDIEPIFEQVEPALILLDDSQDVDFKEYDVIKFSQISKIMREPFDGKLVSRDGGKLYLHTSGTTGIPKCIELDEKQYYGTVPELNRKWEVTNKHSCLFIIPLFHVYALISILHTLYAGTTIIVEYDYKLLDRVLQETHPSLFMGVPLMYNKIRDAVMEKSAVKVKIGIFISNCLRKIGIDVRRKMFSKIHNYFGGEYFFGCSAGSLLSYETNKFFNDVGLPIYNIYGMTEASGAIAMNYRENNRYDSVGKILEINQVKILNKDGDGVGDIYVKGPNIMKGYIGDNKEDYFIDDYFSTGDIGYVKDGYLYVIGRRKNILIGDNGKNISTEELRRKILKYKGIENCNIIMENNYLKAIINSSLRKESVAKIVEEVNEKLPQYKKISGFVITDKKIK